MTFFDKLLRIPVKFKRMSDKRILVRHERRFVLCKYQRSLSARYSRRSAPCYMPLNSQVLSVEADRLSKAQQRTAPEWTMNLLIPTVKSSFERSVFITKSNVYII